MEKVTFKVLALADARSHGSELSVESVYEGEIDGSGTRVYYKDSTNDEWVFYVGETCELIY